MQIIDCHTHRYSPEVFADPIAWGSARGETHWCQLVAPGGLQGWADRDRMLRDMDAAGIEVAVLQGWYWENQSTCDEQNAWHIRWQREDPDRFIALATVQPRAGRAAVESLHRALDEGCRGVGELHAQVQGWDFTSEAWQEIAGLCQDRGLPVCFHATEPVGHPYKGRTETPLMEYVRMAGDFPDLKIVLAHWGGGLPFYELNKWCRKALRHVYYDSAASPLLYDRRVWRTLLDLVGPEKLLFGTDYPLRVYPKKQAEPDFQHMLDEAREAVPEGAAADAVFHRNALRVFGAAALRQ